MSHPQLKIDGNRAEIVFNHGYHIYSVDVRTRGKGSFSAHVHWHKGENISESEVSFYVDGMFEDSKTEGRSGDHEVTARSDEQRAGQHELKIRKKDGNNSRCTNIHFVFHGEGRPSWDVSSFRYEN